ncbi:MAG: streptogrisin [Solirubrobacteraceae bacterium]|nr:streptogrisin [Solirubrobacteraceae bacterium]
MLRSHRTAAAVISLAAASFTAAFAGPALAADGPADGQGSPQEAAMLAYQKAFPKITADAATLAASQQDQRKELYYELAGKEGGRHFGGAYYDPMANVLHVAATDQESADMAAKAGEGLGLRVDAFLVAHSFGELEKQAAAVRARTDDLGKIARSHTGIDVRSNSVQVAVTTAQRALVEGAAKDAGVSLVALQSLRVENDSGCTSRSACDWTIRAGSMIWDSSLGNANNCSVGFTARNASNVRFTYTAGHCSSGAGIGWGTGGQPIGPMGSSRNTGPVDVSIISVTNPWFQFDHGGEIYNEFFPNRTVPVKGVAPTLSFIWSGDVVCLAANFTSPNGPNFCGVVGTSSDPSERGMVRVDGLDACPGDSGGGWYWLTNAGTRIAYGIHSRSDTGCHGSGGGRRSWFSALPTVKSTFTPSLNVETR